jgi:PEP-CTERM motif
MIAKRMAVIWITVIVLEFCGIAAIQAGDLVVNGNFAGTPGLMSNAITDGFGTTTTINGWTADNSWTDVFAPGTADTTGLQGVSGEHRLWGPNDSNPGDPQYAGGGGPYLPAASPVGGNFVATDGAYLSGLLYQNISGLNPGGTYQLGFWWAGSQQRDSTGATSQYWQVSLGSQTQDTPTVDVASHGFSGWTYQTFEFTATATTEKLLFDAFGTPAVPPFLLLDGVTLQSVPEPSTLSLVSIALMVGAAVGLRRRARAKAAAAV